MTSLTQAHADWASGGAYINGRGTYCLYGAEGGHYGKAGMAPWNKEVKAAYTDCTAFHNAAHLEFPTRELAQEFLRPKPDTSHYIAGKEPWKLTYEEYAVIYPDKSGDDYELEITGAVAERWPVPEHVIDAMYYPKEAALVKRDIYGA
jgi:nuclear transport factor 2 (NTF2) superfamily protein